MSKKIDEKVFEEHFGLFFKKIRSNLSGKIKEGYFCKIFKI